MHQGTSLPREVAGVRLPNSALAQKAVDLAFRVSPDAVRTHVVRTFVFGSLVGRGQGLRYDEELFFLAAVLHDLGLTPEFRSTERFEVVGADAAAAFLKDEGVAPERREIVWDAIALHTSIGIASRKRPEIALVHVGAGVDVLGMGLDKLPSTLVAETIEALPRHDFKNAFFSTLLETLAQAPQTATMTWLSEIANEHVPGCRLTEFQLPDEERAFPRVIVDIPPDAEGALRPARGEPRVTSMTLTLKARVRGGRLVLDEPVDLPDGTEGAFFPPVAPDRD